MYRMRAVLPASLVPVIILLGAGCDAGPTAPASAAPSTPTFSVTGVRQPFQGTAGFSAPAPCLGGDITITGPVSGWYQVLHTPTGTTEYTEYDDFSQLTASLGGETWTARPGSHEIWSESLPPVGDATRKVTHEGRTGFDPVDGEGPSLFFVHRIHGVLLPSGDLHFYNVTFEAYCRPAKG